MAKAMENHFRRLVFQEIGISCMTKPEDSTSRI